VVWDGHQLHRRRTAEQKSTSAS